MYKCQRREEGKGSGPLIFLRLFAHEIVDFGCSL